MVFLTSQQGAVCVNLCGVKNAMELRRGLMAGGTRMGGAAQCGFFPCCMVLEGRGLPLPKQNGSSVRQPCEERAEMILPPYLVDVCELTGPLLQSQCGCKGCLFLNCG